MPNTADKFYRWRACIGVPLTHRREMKEVKIDEGNWRRQDSGVD
jgi:hypothetical protein